MQRLSPTLWQLPGVRDSLVLLATHLPHGAVDSMHVVGANRFSNGNVDRSALTYEYHSAQGWGVVTVNVLHELDLRYVDGIRADTLPRSLEALNAFALGEKGAGHYLMLVMLLACAGTAVTACVLTLRTPMPRRWLWALFSLVGTSDFLFNWTTGQTGFALLTVRFLAAGAVRSLPAAPWILSVSFPIGAILALRRVQQARATRAPAVPAAVSAPPDALRGGTLESPVPLGSDRDSTIG
ncbi:MAG: hypothetical protein ACJ796_21695 [Gemmatimonadaceae bacterium]